MSGKGGHGAHRLYRWLGRWRYGRRSSGISHRGQRSSLSATDLLRLHCDERDVFVLGLPDHDNSSTAMLCDCLEARSLLRNHRSFEPTNGSPPRRGRRPRFEDYREEERSGLARPEHAERAFRSLSFIAHRTGRSAPSPTIPHTGPQAPRGSVCRDRYSVTGTSMPTCRRYAAARESSVTAGTHDAPITDGPPAKTSPWHIGKWTR